MTVVFPYIVNGMYWVQSITSKYQQVSEIKVFGVILSSYGAIWSISFRLKYWAWHFLPQCYLKDFFSNTWQIVLCAETFTPQDKKNASKIHIGVFHYIFVQSNPF